MKFLVDINMILYYYEARKLEAVYSDRPYIIWNLYPIAIKDYINPDWSDAQGWVQEIVDGHINFDGIEQLIQYPIEESFKETYEDFAYTEIDVNKIFARIISQNSGEDMTTSEISFEEAIRNATA